MGFLRFLKREKKKSLDELDLPPAPPPLEGFDENMPELPDFPDFGEEKISVPEEKIPEFSFPEKEEMPSLGKDLGFLTFPEIEEKPMPVSAPTQIPEPMPQAEQEDVIQEEKFELKPSDIYSKAEKRLFSQEKKILRERPSGKAIYVRVDKFKMALGGINIVRGDLKKSEDILIKLENIKNVKDKSFNKIKSSLDDLQKKLIFVDKTLFKGD